MNIEIYYFSGTGNSLKIAKDLSVKLGNCQLLPIAKFLQTDLLKSTSKKIGFIFPLYYSGLPKIVYDFVNKINLEKSDYIFTVITSAGDINEFPLQQLKQILETKSKILNAGFFITMPNNYIIGFDIHSKEHQKELFKRAIKKVEKISEIVKKEEVNLKNDIFRKHLTRSEKVNNTFRMEVNESDKSFYVEDSCTSCGICEKVCPVNNISLVKGKPIWQHRCQLCLACINFCPEKSIQFGGETLKTGRYHHPEITIQEIINQKS
ncbi:MAG: EFR1 family ferrodoxin [Promethearchaeota archaeon]